MGVPYKGIDVALFNYHQAYIAVNTMFKSSSIQVLLSAPTINFPSKELAAKAPEHEGKDRLPTALLQMLLLSVCRRVSILIALLQEAVCMLWYVHKSEVDGVRLYTGSFAKFLKKTTCRVTYVTILWLTFVEFPKVTDIVAAAEEDGLISPEARHFGV